MSEERVYIIIASANKRHQIYRQEYLSQVVAKSHERCKSNFNKVVFKRSRRDAYEFKDIKEALIVLDTIHFSRLNHKRDDFFETDRQTKFKIIESKSHPKAMAKTKEKSKRKGRGSLYKKLTEKYLH